MLDEFTDARTIALNHQLDELALLRASLLPGESLVFLGDDGSDSDATDEAPSAVVSSSSLTWEQRLARHSAISPEVIGVPDAGETRAPPPAHFAMRANDSGDPAWFEVLLPRAYIGALDGGSRMQPVILAKGAQLGRREQEAWQTAVDDALMLDDVKTSQYPIFELFSAHLLPLLHNPPSSFLPPSIPVSAPSHTISTPPSSSNVSVIYHALLTSHHLRSPQKRRFLAQTSAAHSLRGFAKVGHPGVIYACGPREGVETFVAGVCALTWLALRTRFVEPLPKEVQNGDEGGKAWVEFEKVGEVVEYMRGIGRDAYVVEMGIGSAGVK